MNKTYSNLYWVAHQLGFSGDTVTCFFNMQVGRIHRYRGVYSRTRCDAPGILLNWASYYPRWHEYQKHDPNLDVALHYSNNQMQFSQAHFVMEEGELLNRFPQSTVITVLASTPEMAVIHNAFGHRKLLDKKLFSMWYLRQKLNFPISQKKNIELADECFRKGMTVLQYRCISYMDRHGFTIDTCPVDPVSFWASKTYLTNFLENPSTALINNTIWQPKYNPSKQIPLYIDQLANVETKKLNHDYYEELCERIGIFPDHNFYRKFWNDYLARQPNIDYKPNLVWPF